MIEFLSSLGLFGIVLIALIVLILSNLRGVIRARNPRATALDARVAQGDADMSSHRQASGGHAPMPGSTSNGSDG